MEVIKKSIQRLGTGRSVVVDKDGKVCAGSGTIRAALAAGVKKATVIESDGKTLIVVKRSDWTDQEAEAYGIVDNQASDLSSFITDKLRDSVERLKEVDEEMQLVQVIGFTDEELEALCKSAEAVTLDVNFQATVGGEKEPNVTCPKCGFQWHK